MRSRLRHADELTTGGPQSYFRSEMANPARQSIALIVGGAGVFCAWELAHGNPKFYSNVIMPALHAVISAEKAHTLAVKIFGHAPKTNFVDPDCLRTTVWNKNFSNPIGIAAGFDKHAEAMTGLSNIGFGFIEIGSVTPLPQKGNPKPRVFRLSEDKSVINRYGFNSCGHDEVSKRLDKWRAADRETILGVNLGKNKASEDHVKDYVTGVAKLGLFADYIVINVSSPNTPGLRKLQGESFLKDMLMDINKERNLLQVNPKPALLVKISPDLERKELEDIAKVVLCKDCGVEGLIISNTTVQRPESLRSAHKDEIGGLSGPPLKEKSTEFIRTAYALTQGNVPIIGVGGISSGEDAYEKIRAGASLVQFYTALVYNGPPVLKAMKSELANLLQKDGYISVGEAVGADHKR